MVNKIIEGKKISTNRVPTKVSAEYKDLGGKTQLFDVFKVREANFHKQDQTTFKRQ